MSAPVTLPPQTPSPTPASALSPPPAAPSSDPAVAPPTATVLDGAVQALAALASGATLAGTIAPGGDDGIAILLTALGTVSLASSAPLPAGTSITLQQAADQPGTAVILTVNGTPTVPTASAPVTPTPSPPLLLDLGTVIEATIVAPAASSNLPAPSELPVPSGAPAAPVPPPQSTTLPPSASATPATGAAPGIALAEPPTTPPAAPPGPAGSGNSALPDAPAPIVTSAPRPAAAAPSTAPPQPAEEPPGPILPPGTRLALRVLAVQPADDAARPALTGTIRPPAAPGAPPVLDTPAGKLTLQGAPPLPPGTRVALQLLPDAPAAALLTLLASDAPPIDSASPSTAVAPQPQRSSDGGATTQRPVPAAAATPEAPGAPAPATAAPPPVRVSLAVPELALAPSGHVAQVLTGTVLATLPDRAAPLLVATPLGILAVAPRLAVPGGSLLLLSAQDVAPLSDIGDDRSPTPAGSWSGLATALTALNHAAPALAAQLRADLAPLAGGDRLAASFLFLIGALRGSTPFPWPGETVTRALAAADRDDAKTALADDLGEARRIAASPATGAWQVFLLPLIDGAAVRPLRLYYKRRDGSDGREPAEDSARFILEFELSRLGALQLDGFVQHRRFDLMLRTKAPLGAALESAVERIFHDRIVAAGIAGRIDFATVARFEVAPLDGLREPVAMAV